MNPSSFWHGGLQTLEYDVERRGYFLSPFIPSYDIAVTLWYVGRESVTAPPASHGPMRPLPKGMPDFGPFRTPLR